MRTYTVFGLRLRTDVSLAEAEEADGDAFDCILRHRAEAPPPFAGAELGEEIVFADVRVHSFARESGYRLAYDDTGAFDISGDGSEITWWSGGRPADDAVETDILGRVLAFALHGKGILTLHASAVDVAGSGIAFLGPKAFGKSTLATAMVNRGSRLITDDSLAVELSMPPKLRPGIQHIRLRQDAATHNKVRGDESRGAKVRVRPDAGASVATETTPFRAIYVLTPMAELQGRAPVERERCSEIQATLSVVSCRKLGALLAGQGAATAFEAAATLARSVPTYSLQVIRDLTRLDGVAEALCAWHTSSTSLS